MSFASRLSDLSAAPQGVTATVDGRHTLTVQILDDGLGRVRLVPNGVSLVDRSWMVAPQGEVPWRGRDRDDISGFANPQLTVEADIDGPGRAVLTGPRLRVEVEGSPLRLTWYVRTGDAEATVGYATDPGDGDGEWRLLASDRVTGAYLVTGTGAVEHYQNRPAAHRYWGLGTRSGDLERTGRRFDLRALDAMGYDAGRTDPLYGHVPFTITTGSAVPFGMLYDNLAAGAMDLGLELDNYHAPYRRYRAECGDLDYYLFAADPAHGIDEITRTAVRLTGGVAFPPRWSLGYSGSTMAYTDAPDASERLGEFIDGCERHGIPCDSFQLSSGYTLIRREAGDKRYVFTWNRDKFPDPAATAAQFAAAGMPLVANIKPCLLHDHPAYDELRAGGLFAYVEPADEPATEAAPERIRQPAPERSYFWGDVGSHLDFTNPRTRAWWRDQVRTRLLEVGIAATWNDNNEYEVWDDEVMCAGDGTPIPMRAVRPLQALLMCRTSLEAQVAHSPAERPYLITRSGPLGLQRYAQTWSGDNSTSWASLRYNVRMGVGMSMSGLLNFGHDAGGFSGPQPDAELLVRWVQSCALLPRFTIHSWNDDGSVTEPWSHPEATEHVRDALRLRYELLPHLYTLLWRAHVDGTPIVRPRFAAFSEDPAAYDECDDFLVGDDLLVAPVVEPGAHARSVYLPHPGTSDVHAHGWFHRAGGTWHAPGSPVSVEAPLAHLPLFVRAGGGLLTTGPGPAPRPGSLHRRAAVPQPDQIPGQLPGGELELWPAPPERAEVTTEGFAFDDDGVGHGYRDGEYALHRWRMTSTPGRVRIRVTREGDYAPDRPLRVRLPAHESRPVTLDASPAVAVLVR